MRILGLHYFAPPVAVVSSRRLVGIYRELAKRADSIEIITSANHRQRDFEAAYAHDFTLHFANGDGLREKLFGKNKSSVNNRQKTGGNFRFLNRWRQSFPFLLLTDEGGPAYYRNALRLASQLIESKGITHLISSYRPWVDHRIAAALKKRYPQLAWIADFRDLPVDGIRRDVALPALQKWWSKKTVERADEIWLVSEGQREQFGNLRTETRVVYNGLDRLPEISEPEPNDVFTIGYTGSLYPGLQSVRLLNLALAELADKFEQRLEELGIALNYIGKDEPVWEGFFEKNDNWKFPIIRKKSSPPLPQHLTRHHQSTHTVNLLLTWSGPGYYGVLTAKLYDYLAAGRPILALVNGPDDPELRGIIEGSGAGRVFCPGQEAELAAWLQELYISWRENSNRLPWRTDADHLAYLTLEQQIASLPW